MGKANPFEKEKLVVGVMYTSEEQYEAIMTRLEKEFGPSDSASEEYAFSDFSVYYDREMSGRVLKRFVSFRDLVSPETLPEIKLWSNSVEDEYAVAGDRKVNIDPCLISHGKFTMATTKGASFRIPIRDGIYADLSLVYSNGQWNHFFWTYADVKSEPIEAYLAQVRRIYLEQRKAAKSPK